MHDLVGDVRGNAACIAHHILLDVLSVVVVRILRACRVLGAIGSSARALPSHMHLVFGRRGSLRDHGAVCYPGIDHRDLAMGLSLVSHYLFVVLIGLDVLLIDKVRLDVLVLILQTLLDQRQIVETLIGIVELVRFRGRLLVALQLILLEHVLPVFHDDILLILMCMRFIARIGSFLWTDSRIQIILSHSHLLRRYLLAASTLIVGRVVHVDLVYIRLIGRTASLFASSGVVLLAYHQMLLVLRRRWAHHIGCLGRSHLVLRCVSRLPHGRLRHRLGIWHVGSSRALIRVVPINCHLIISTSILIEAALELLRLTYLIIGLIVLLLHVLTAVSTSVDKSSSSSRLALSIRVGVVPALLANQHLLSIVLEEVHPSVWTCSLLEVYHVL